MRTLTDEDTSQNKMPTILEDLISKSQGSEGGKGGKGEGRKGRREERGMGEKGEGRKGGREKVDKKMLSGETKVTLN